MPRKVTDKELQDALNAFHKYGGSQIAADAIGVAESTLRGRVSQARRKIKAGDSTLNEPGVSEAEGARPTLALEQENRLLRDKVSSLSQKLKAHFRNQGVFEALCDEMNQVIEPLTPLPAVVIKPKRKKEHVESLVMHLSDEHADQIVEPHRVNGFEHYNYRVALARAERFVDKVISISQNTLSNYRFNELWILAYGDHINGEIHDNTNHSEFKNVLDNSIAIGQMHALMVRDLAPYFKEIKVLYLSGNHGRRTKKKNYQGPKDNWDYLVGRVAEMLSLNLPNVEFLIPDSFSYTFEINGWNFCAFHGDDIRSWNSIPHYGIERKTRRLSSVHSAQGRTIHYYVMGHFHGRSSFEHPSGEIIMNGSWKATDEFLYESLGAVCRPSQVLHGVGKTYGISFRFPIYLKFEGDVDGPSRYTAPLKALGHLEQIEKF